MRYVLCTCSMLLGTLVGAQWLDPTFGTGGISSVPGASSLHNVVRQPDGKLLVSSNDGYIRRMLPDGAPDPDFGTNGAVQYLLDCVDQDNRGMAVQPDGRIVVAAHSLELGTLHNMGIVFRMLPNGDLDSTFSSDGVLYYNGPFDRAGFACAEVLADGRILIGGYLGTDSVPTTVGQMVMRLMPDGSFDPSFGPGAIVTHVVGDYVNYVYEMVVLPDGDILVAGTSATQTSSLDYLVTRFNSDGTLDAAFGTGGHRLIVPSNLTDYLLCMAVQPDGKILLGGTFNEQTTLQHSALIMRLNADGSTDNTFANNGTLLFSNGYGAGRVAALHVRADGSILAAGVDWPVLLTRYAALWCFDTDGQLNTAFGDNGVILHGDTIETTTCSDMTVQPDGKPVLLTRQGALGDQVLRYLSSGNIGIGEHGGNDAISITPVGHGSFTVQVPAPGQVSVALYDVHGRVLHQWAPTNIISEGRYSVPHQLTTGLYVVVAHADATRAVLPLLLGMW